MTWAYTVRSIPHDITVEELKALDNVKGIILNGGENRVVDGRPVDIDPALYGCGVPVMAIDHPTAQCGLRYPSIPEEEVLKDFVLGTVQSGNKLEYEELYRRPGGTHPPPGRR